MEKCRHSGKEVAQIIDHYDTIVMAGAWGSYFKPDQGGFNKALHSSISSLLDKGKQVVVLGRVPRIGTIDRKCAQKALKLRNLDCGNSAQGPRNHVDRINSSIKNTALTAGARYFDISHIICDDVLCNGIIDGRFVYFDQGHLSMSGSIYLGSLARKLRTTEEVFGDFPSVKEEHQIPPPWYGNNGQSN
jgi:hypothetical protein